MWIRRLGKIIFNAEVYGTYTITAGLHGVKQYKETNFRSFHLHVSNNLFSTKSATQVKKKKKKKKYIYIYNRTMVLHSVFVNVNSYTETV
jgi:hypothetical protein